MKRPENQHLLREYVQGSNFWIFAIFLGVGQDVSFLTCPDKTFRRLVVTRFLACKRCPQQSEEEVNQEIPGLTVRNSRH